MKEGEKVRIKDGERKGEREEKIEEAEREF